VVDASPWKHKHRLIEENSNTALPRLYAEARRYELIFLDGWKTPDHLIMDVYFSARLLKVGGILVFDDTRMKAVRRTNKLLVTHYGFEEIDYAALGERLRTWFWFRATTRSFRRPYRAFRKYADEAQWPACRSYQFYARF